LSFRLLLLLLLLFVRSRFRWILFFSILRSGWESSAAAMISKERRGERFQVSLR
jgi:hypothetical protein